MALAPDFAPLWLPADEAVITEHARAQPADRVDGWTWPSLLLATVAGSLSKTLSRGGAVLACLAVLVTTPTLARGNATELLQLALGQVTILTVLLLITRRVRSASAGTVGAFWLGGMFTVPLLVRLTDRLLSTLPGIDGAPIDWIRPVVTVALLTLPLLVAVQLGRSRWTVPGIGDLLVLGVALGAGFSFHEDGLLDVAAGSSIGTGHHAVWMGLIGVALGLGLHERRDDVAAVGAVAITVLVLGDVTILALRWLPLILLVGLLGTVVMLDRQRLDAIAERDHLFPDATEGHHDVLVGRYRRLRNGVHSTVAAHGEQWPPVADAPVAELARAARAASIAVGREVSRFGWDRNPDDRTGRSRRFFGPDGWTLFTVDRDGPGTSVPRSRPEARRVDPVTGLSDDSAASWKTDRQLGWVGGAVVVLVVVAVLTASTDLLGAPMLASADPGPPIVRTIIGSVGAAAAISGRMRPELGEAWEVGPPQNHEV